MTELDDETVARFSEALLKPLADVGALLARAVDDLHDEVAQLKAELAEARSDHRALDNAFRSHIRMHNRGEAS